MKRPIQSLLLAGGLAFSGWAAGPNLLSNGNLLESPNPAKTAGVEEHGNTWKAPLEAGASVPGFTVTRARVYLVASKKSGKRWLDLNGNGGVSQNLSVSANRSYLLKFTLEGDPKGRGEQSVAIEGAGLNTSENVDSQGRRVVKAQFTPTSTQAALEIRATSGGRGPRIFDLSVEAQ